MAQFFPDHDTGQPAVVEFVTLGCEDCLQWRDTGYASAAVTEHGAAYYVFEVDPSNNTTAMPQLREHYSDAAVVDLTPEQVEAVNLANLPTTFFMFNARDAMLLNHQAAYEVDSSQMDSQKLEEWNTRNEKMSEFLKENYIDCNDYNPQITHLHHLHQ